MKQNMCVTIDEEVHSWLKSKHANISRVVNNYLASAMWKEMRQRSIIAGEQLTLELYYCSKCRKYPQGEKKCECGNTDLRLIAGQNDQ